jgi:hypothetical protein
MDTKRCPKCNTEKPLTKFYSDKSRPGGTSPYCISCHSQYAKERYLANPKYFRQRSNTYYYDDPERSREIQRQFKLRHPERARKDSENYRLRHRDDLNAKRRKTGVRARQRYAETQIAARIADGRIIRPSKCSRCGRVVFVNAHHPDYSKPLSIIWLCSRCHGLIHRK